MSKLGGFELLAQEAADEAYRNVMMLRDEAYGDSPIECLFFAALVTAPRICGRIINQVMRVDETRTIERLRVGVRHMGESLTTVYVERQVKIAGWRVDYLLSFPARDVVFDENGDPSLDRLIVECDGHDFHARTKEQAKRDRSRDRIAQYEGIPIFRFTGSELWNDPIGCADEVLQFMERG